jgi:hypothetical protein
MTTFPPTDPFDSLEIGDSVRLVQLHESVPAGAEGRVVGFYRVEPPRMLVAFEQGACAVLESELERIT